MVKNAHNSSSPEPEGQRPLALGCVSYQVCSNDYSRLTQTYVTVRSYFAALFDSPVVSI